MKRTRSICFCVFACLASLVTVTSTLADVSPIYDFEGPGSIGGAPGSVVSQVYFCRMTLTGGTRGDPGPQGWSIGVTTDDGWQIAEASSRGTVSAPVRDGGMRENGFESIQRTNDDRGIVAAIVLNLIEITELDPVGGPYRILALDVQGRVPVRGDCTPCTLLYRNGMRGLGGPVNNGVVIDAETVEPRLVPKRVQVCPVQCFEPEPSPGWGAINVGDVLVGSSRPKARARDAYELCSASAGYENTADSFRFLFRLLRSDFQIDARLDRLDSSGCAGLDVRQHMGSSRLSSLPYVGIGVTRGAAGGLQLRTTYRANNGGETVVDAAPALPVQLPVFLRIEREDETYRTLFSPDGRNYREHAKIDGSGTGLRAPIMRGGMKQASRASTQSIACFSSARTQIFERQRPPRLFRIDPNIGPVDGGIPVTISGANLIEASEVRFGPEPARIMDVSDDSIVVLSPELPRPGNVDVTVVTSGGAQRLRNAFTAIGRTFIRGDCQGDGRYDVSDAVGKLNRLFRGGPDCQCDEAFDSNGDGKKDLSDGVYDLGGMFLGSANPPPPWPLPGIGTSPHLPCGSPPKPTITSIELPNGPDSALAEGDLITIVGRNFGNDPSRLLVMLGEVSAEVTEVQDTLLRAKVGMVPREIEAASVSVFEDFTIGPVVRSCAPFQCYPFIVSQAVLQSRLNVSLVASEGVGSLGSSRFERDEIILGISRPKFLEAVRAGEELEVGVSGRLILPAVQGLSRGSQALQLRLRGGPSRGSFEEFGEDIAAQIGKALAGGDLREFDVFFDRELDAVRMPLDPELADFVRDRRLTTKFDLSIYCFRPPPCTCEADLDEDGEEESYSPLTDERGYAWCRLYHLWSKTCNGLPKWEYFFPRNCTMIESGSVCESDGTNSGYPVYPLPHPHTIDPEIKSAMFNRSAHCHIREHGLWNRCKLRDLELEGKTQVPHFDRDAIVVKTLWSQNPPGNDNLYYSYDYDDGNSVTTWYLTAWHFTDKCIDKWTWCDLYMDASLGGGGGCGGTNADIPPALVGSGLDNYYMCANTDITQSDTHCGNNFFPECNEANCMHCHSPDGAPGTGFAGANSAWSNSIGDGTLGSDFLYSLTTGPAVPTGGLSDGDHPSCND